jgi:hypothetical protein
VLVVNKDTGLPGAGLTTIDHLGRDRERVFAHPWYKTLPPTAAEFEEAERAGSQATLDFTAPLAE